MLFVDRQKVSLFAIIVCFIFASFELHATASQECTGPYMDGKHGNIAQLTHILEQNKKHAIHKLLPPKYREQVEKGKKANFCGADLTDTNLEKADLRFSVLNGANLSSANLKGANLRDAKMANANLLFAQLAGAIFELKKNTLPDIRTMALAFDLEKLTYEQSAASLYELRKAFVDAGLKSEARKITYAIKHTELQMNDNKLDSIFNYVLFEIPVAWGMHPERPLIVLIILIPFFAVFYIPVIFLNNTLNIFGAGIYRVWDDERVNIGVGCDKPERIYCKSYKSVYFALYFSILSAFHVGWRDVNVGNWIVRMQPNEYILKSTGWVRCISGFQSLISVYLLALCILSYFGQPFG